jgi:Rrf2 family protein
MELTRAADYALRGVLYLSMQPRDSLCIISEIAEKMDIPEGFLARIFQILAKSGIIRSHRGKRGGFSLSKPPEEIVMKDVIEALEGPIHLNRCLSDYSDCGKEGICSLHEVWAEIQTNIVAAMEAANFADLAKRTQEKLASNV